MKIAGLIISGILTVGAAACTGTDAQERPEGAAQPVAVAEQTVAGAPVVSEAPVLPPLSAADEEMYRQMARDSWAYMDTYYQPSTGFVNATPEWAYTTVWDIGAQLLAYMSARELDLIPEDVYQQRMERTLKSLEEVPLFRNLAFNKTYSATDGSAGDGTRGATGWSATDLGRLLVALKVVAVREPQWADEAQRIVNRMDYSAIVKGGYVHGQLLGTNQKPWTFQEGRIGYEQYVARGFDAWGKDVDNALNVRTNARPVKVHGVEILADGRKLDRLLSEPFVLMGVELGLDGDMRDLGANVLAAQEARYRETGQVTIVSEDAVAVKPTYFYYYCVYCNGKPFVVDISSPGNERQEPRWVSTKGAHGWHALMPSAYTKRAIDHVAPAHDAKRGWASGVYEGSGASTQTWDINTAAVLLEIAAYQLRGRRPLIEP